MDLDSYFVNFEDWEFVYEDGLGDEEFAHLGHHVICELRSPTST